MSEWKARRFWKDATVERDGTEYTVHLDGRQVKTPGKLPLVVPTKALADAITREWAVQDESVDPRTMPVTRSANAAIDKVTPQMTEVVQLLADYADADLTCYRVAEPAELVARQSAAWDPLLDWTEHEFGARLIPVQGVMHAPQAQAVLQRLTVPLHAMSAFELTGFHDLVSLSGSFVIGLAAAHRHVSVDVLWGLSRIDEVWQQEQWGVDVEAAAMAKNKNTAFLEARDFHGLARFFN